MAWQKNKQSMRDQYRKETDKNVSGHYVDIKIQVVKLSESDNTSIWAYHSFSLWFNTLSLWNLGISHSSLWSQESIKNFIYFNSFYVMRKEFISPSLKREAKQPNRFESPNSTLIFSWNGAHILIWDKSHIGTWLLPLWPCGVGK